MPATTSKNKDEKIKKLKYDLVIDGVKILGIKELPVAKLANGGAAGDVIDLKVMMKLKTIKKKTEMESLLEPDFSLEKIKEMDNEYHKSR